MLSTFSVISENIEKLPVFWEDMHIRDLANTLKHCFELLSYRPKVGKLLGNI